MRVQFHGANSTDWVLASQPGATVGELLTALGAGDAPGATIDGRWWPAAEELESTGIAAGSRVELSAPRAAPAPTAELVVRGGPDAGRRIQLPPGDLVLGRASGGARLDDPALSARHARLTIAPSGDVRVDDLGSTNGTSFDGSTLRAGTSMAIVEAADATRPAAPTARHPRNAHHRPPRDPLPPAPEPLDPPAAPAEPERPRLSIATLAVPLGTGAVLAALYGPKMAIIAVVGPVVALGGWLAARWSAGRATQQLHRDHARALDAFRDQAVAAASNETARRRAASPDLVQLCDRALVRDPRLWERRQHHDDFLELEVGPGDIAWTAPTARPPDAVASAVLTETARLCSVPVTVNVRGLVGICGSRMFAVPIARALVARAVVLHGPADLQLAVLTSVASAPDWTWARWLPHGRDPLDEDRVLLAPDAVAALDLAAALDGSIHQLPGNGPLPFLVVDGDDEQLVRRGPVRALLAPRRGGERAAVDGDSPTGIVVADRRDHLPAACTTVIRVDGAGAVAVERLDEGGPASSTVQLVGLGTEQAERIARALAPLTDPEATSRSGELPDGCELLHLIGAGDEADAATVDGVTQRWRRSAGTDELVGTIGVDDRGPVDVDLVRDGPHALVAGTTGAGKSELLRSLVATLAVSANTEHLNFLLVDFKGGAAFDRLTALPHVVGLVTDLDEHLAARALRCLDAELRRRERVLRAASASDVTAYVRERRARPSLEPLPRLVVVVDEFATLVAELPDFVDALVDVAQRGRSLGVHLVLATQRPAGAVKDSIRANTNLRIALRVVEPADSRDVVACDDAAHLPRHRPGRAILRSGSAEPVAFQAAQVSGPARRGRPAAVVARRWRLDDPPAARAPAGAGAEGPSGIDEVVRAVGAAHRATGHAAPRRPWPDPLPATVRRRDLIAGDASAFALADRPDQQETVPLGWDPSRGNLLVAGLAGSGVTTALSAVAVALADAHPASALHLYAIGNDLAALHALEALPQCGAVMAGDDLERVLRLLRMLDGEIRDRRRSTSSDLPIIVTLLDGIGSLRAELDSAGLLDELDTLERLAADGPGSGVVFAFGAEHPHAIGHRLDRTVPHRLLMRLPERADYVHVGLPAVDPQSLVAGRGFLADGTEVQVVIHDDSDIARIVARDAAARIGRARPQTIGRLPDDVPAGQLRGSARGDVLTIPIGIGDRHLDAVSLSLRSGDHVIVTGPARSGKSTALQTIGKVVAATGSAEVVDLQTERRSTARPSPQQLHDLVAELLTSTARTVVLVDDADLLDDGGALVPLVQPGRPGLHVVAAGRGDRLRGLFRHWTAEVRRSRLAILLRGDELDGDLVGARLPRRPPAPWRVGRGWLVTDDAIEQCQVARPWPDGVIPTDPTTPIDPEERENDQCA